MYTITGLGCAALIVLSGTGARTITTNFRNHLFSLNNHEIVYPKTVPLQRASARPVVKAYGFADTEIDDFGKYCLQWVRHKQGSFMDLASGWGLMTHHALRYGSKLAVANEIHPYQLADIQFHTPERYLSRLNLLLGRFPMDFPNNFRGYERIPEQFDTIYGGRFWHFLDPEQRRLAAQKLHTLVADGGAIFITAATPFNHKTEKSSYELYLSQVSRKYPERKRGLVKRRNLPVAQRRFFPEEFYLLIPEVIEQEFYDAGFDHVESIYYSEPAGRLDNVAESKSYSGMERAGVFAWKGKKPPFRLVLHPTIPGRNILVQDF